MVCGLRFIVTDATTVQCSLLTCSIIFQFSRKKSLSLNLLQYISCNYQMLSWKYEQRNMHSQTCPSINKSAIEVIPRERNAKIRSKPETKIWNILCFGIRNLQGQNPESSTWNLESTKWNPESNTVLDYLTWGELCCNYFISLRKKISSFCLLNPFRLAFAVF